MSSLQTSPTGDPSASSDRRYARQRETNTLRGAAHERWLGARILQAGAGATGSPLAQLAARCGATLQIHDFDLGELENLGTQDVLPGVAKAPRIAERCNAIRPGSARGVRGDIRHVGIETMMRSSVLVDCTDDVLLARPLTLTSNALGIPCVRIAVDPFGAEMGRVLVSHGGAGHACQLCTKSFADLRRGVARTACPGRVTEGPLPTVTGAPIATAVAALGLLQIQRLIGGNDVELAVDREVILDLGGLDLHSFELQRSDACISGHERWTSFTRLDRTASETTVAHLFELAEREFGTREVVLEPFLHPLCLAADCGCGALQPAVGSEWAEPPRCEACGAAMEWRRDLKKRRVGAASARQLGLLEMTLARLGLPLDGALVVASSPGRPALRFLLQSATEEPESEVSHD